MITSIILKKQDWSEADELVVFFSRDLGWLTGVAKNAKRSRVRFGGHLEPFALVDLTLRARKRDDLVWIDDAQVVQGFLDLRSDIARIAWASYFFELASALLPEGQADSDVFDFLLRFLELLNGGEPQPFRLVLDEIRLLGLLGYAPRFDICPACGVPLGGGEEAVFSPAAGGACHPGCVESPEERQLFLSPDTLAVIRRGLETDSRLAQRLRFSRKHLAEAQAALSAFVRYLRGAEINSLVFIEHLGLA